MGAKQREYPEDGLKVSRNRLLAFNAHFKAHRRVFFGKLSISIPVFIIAGQPGHLEKAVKSH